MRSILSHLVARFQGVQSSQGVQFYINMAFRWDDVLPDFGMLYREKRGRLSRREIDAIRHVTHKGKMRFVNLHETCKSMNPESALIARLDTERLLAKLTAKQREAVWMAEAEGFGHYRKLGAALGILPCTAHHRYAAGMKKLRGIIA